MAKKENYLSRNDAPIDLRPLFLTLFFLLMIPLYSSAQSRQELEKQRVQLQNEIKELMIWKTMIFDPKVAKAKYEYEMLREQSKVSVFLIPANKRRTSTIVNFNKSN